MIDLQKRRPRYSDERDEISHDLRVARSHPARSHATMLWVGVGTAVLGAGASIYGSQQQKKAINSANNTNANLQQNQNDQAWTNYLMTRGISPTTPIRAGQMPTGGQYVAVNTRLPLWAGVQARPTSGGFLIKQGQPVTYSMGMPSLGGVDSSSDTAQGTAGGGGASMSDFLKKATKDHLAIIDPIQGLKRIFG